MFYFVAHSGISEHCLPKLEATVLSRRHRSRRHVVVAAVVVAAVVVPSPNISSQISRTWIPARPALSATGSIN